MEERKEKGQGLVEFALILIPLVLLGLVIINAADLYMVRATMTRGVNRGVNTAIVWDPGGGETCEQTVRNAIDFQLTRIPEAELIVDGCTGVKGSEITVTIRSKFEPAFYGTLGNPSTPWKIPLEDESSLIKY